MRKKELRLVVSFDSTTAAMALERYCLENGIPGRLIPIPRQITAGCGLAWSAPPDARTQIEAAAGKAGIPIADIAYLEL